MRRALPVVAAALLSTMLADPTPASAQPARTPVVPETSPDAAVRAEDHTRREVVRMLVKAARAEDRSTARQVARRPVVNRLLRFVRRGATLTRGTCGGPGKRSAAEKEALGAFAHRWGCWLTVSHDSSTQGRTLFLATGRVHGTWHVVRTREVTSWHTRHVG